MRSKVALSWYETLMGTDVDRGLAVNRDSRTASHFDLGGSPGSAMRGIFEDDDLAEDKTLLAPDGKPDVDPEMEGQVCGPAVPPPHETLRTVGAIVKAFIGSGILFLPSAFQQGGYGFSVGFMLLMAVLNGFGMLRLLRCREKVVGSYGYVGYAAMGRTGQVAVDASLVLSQAGFCCVYVSFIAQNALQILNAGSCWIGGEWLWLLILLQVLIFAPLTWVRRIASFGATNIVADVCIIGGLVGIMAFCIQGLISFSTGPNKNNSLHVIPFNENSFALFMGTAIYAFEGIGMTTPLYNSLSPRGQSRFGWILGCTLCGVSLAYVIFGLVPYLWFAGVQDVIMSAGVTLYLPRVWWAYLIKGAYCIALAFSYPFMLAPAVAICEKPLVPRFLAPVASETHRIRRNIFRTFIVCCTLAVSVAGADMLNNFVSLIGAFCCAPLAFVYPCLFHLIIIKPTNWSSRFADVAMIVFGTAVFGFSTWQAIAGWSSSVMQPCI